jgi:AraC-like DNA-binding protein
VVLSEIRVERAKILLRDNPDVIMREVAAGSGFSESRRLNLVFQRFMGMTPRQYLQQMD